MRKIYIFILSFIGMFCLSMPMYATYVQADTITKYTGTAGSLSWELDRTSGVFTISGDGAIPDYQTVRPLNPIYPSWYQYRNEIRTIEFEGNITTIGTYSFYGCNNLVSTNIPDSVTHIYNDAFRGCDSLKNVTLGDNVQYFGDRVFYDIDGTVDVYIININNWVKNISFGSQWDRYIYDARYHIVNEFNQAVSELKLSNDVTAIRPYTFANFVDLKKIEFSNNITSIGRSAFENCDLIESIILPEGVKTIGVDAFSSCSRLSTLIIPSSVTSIGEDSFSKSISKIIYCGDETQWKELMGIPLWDTNPYTTQYHNYEYIKVEENAHQLTCSYCNTKLDTANCSGGTATCTTKARCDVCKSEYGELNQDNHTPTTTWTSANGQHYHTCLNGCNTKLDTANCSGDSATCTTKAKCDVCKSEYGDVLGHKYGEWVSNGNNTHTKTCGRDSTHKVTENCGGGTATCTAKAVCGDCESEYGNMLEHTYDKTVATSNYLEDAATCTSKAVYYKSCVCGLASKSETFEYGEVLGHTYQENWCSDENSHWHECECGEKSDVAAHSWNNGIVNKEPTTKEECERVFTCNDCGIQKIESIAKKEVPVGAIVGATVGGAGVVGLGGFTFVWFVVKKKSWAELLAIFKRK